MCFSSLLVIPRIIKHTTSELLVAMLDVKINLMSNFWTLCGIGGLRAEERRQRNQYESKGNSTEHDGDCSRENVVMQSWEMSFSNSAQVMDNDIVLNLTTDNKACQSKGDRNKGGRWTDRSIQCSIFLNFGFTYFSD